MPQFRYEAMAANGEMIVGLVAAESREAAIRSLRQRGVIPLKAEIDRENRPARSGAARWVMSQRVDRRDVLVFTRELATLLKAGISLDRALDRLAESRRQRPLGKVLSRVSADVKSGDTLAVAMARSNRSFPPFYTGLVTAGEAAGTLPDVLDDVASVMQQAQELRDKISESLLYPLIVLVLIAVSFVILMAWVVPEFRPLLERQGEELPLSATLVLGLSNIVVNWGWLLSACLVGAAVVIWRVSKGDAFRRVVDHLLLRLPEIGKIVRQLEAARYCRSLGTLLSNGVSLLDAVDIAGRTVANRVVARALSSARAGLSRGNSLTDALAASGVLPRMTLDLIDVGEESGNLERMLPLAATTCQQDAQRTLEKMVTLLAPIVTVVLGIFVALVIGSILSAMLATYNVAA